MSQILQKVPPIGESRDKEILKSASSYVYASYAGFDLQAHVFFPKETQTSNRSVVAFFHGGFWDVPMATQFVPHCHHFASRGAVAVTFEYRTSSKNATGPAEALEDAIAAFKWLVENAELLSIDATKITLGGSGGGAWLALLLSMMKSKESPLPVRPHSLILFSALVNTTAKSQYSERFANKKTASKLSPSKLIRRKLPPMLFLHGKSDRITPIDDVASFCRRSKWRGNKISLLDFTGAEHTFFNFNVSHSNFEMTIGAADHFLTGLGSISKEAEDSTDFNHME